MFRFPALAWAELELTGLLRPFPNSFSTPDEIMAWMDVHNLAPNNSDHVNNEEDSLDFSVGSDLAPGSDQAAFPEEEHDPFSSDLDVEEEVWKNLQTNEKGDTENKRQTEDVVPEKNMIGFSTAKGKTINISDEALKKARLLWNNTNNPEEVEEISAERVEESNPFRGFSTAKGASVQVSEKALASARKMFENCADEEKEGVKKDRNVLDKFGEEKVGFQTASGSKIKITEKAVEQAKKLFEELDEENRLKTLPSFPIVNEKLEIAVTVGFQTASGSKIDISKKAVAQAKKLFEDLDEENRLKTLPAFPIVNEKLEIAATVGFQTASGSKIDISEKAVALAKKLFEDLDEENQLKTLSAFPKLTKKLEISNTEGFQTSSGSKIDISEKVVAQAKKLFEDLDEENQLKTLPALPKLTEKLETAAPVGFQTASGSKIEISEKAVAQAKKLFENLDEENQLKALQTLNNTENKKLLKHFDEESQLKEFQATTKTSTIPTSQLTIPLQNEYEVGFERIENVGFQICSGRQIKVSDDAVARARKMFEESSQECDEGISKVNIKENVEPDIQQPSKKIKLDTDAVKDILPVTPTMNSSTTPRTNLSSGRRMGLSGRSGLSKPSTPSNSSSSSPLCRPSTIGRKKLPFKAPLRVKEQQPLAEAFKAKTESEEFEAQVQEYMDEVQL